MRGRCCKRYLNSFSFELKKLFEWVYPPFLSFQLSFFIFSLPMKLIFRSILVK
ncbi:hypothetical protein HMPREF1425_00141 [Helicobacter pylori GAM71Ai]|nr:hypothetical protein HMPREF1406_00367 [Helicobacter pylori GAM239Bi]EMH37705.1 hypothetical protein HMPREF1425_00141 [Helicobacter pylori GAM71Ai]EMJ45394.1 hypothetical protein HMPREF1434_00059 [Helicobacter pylori GAMchJs124i]